MTEIPPTSLLILPGDSERKIAKAAESGADAIILDLEDSVKGARQDAARQMVREYLEAHPVETRTTEIWVRISPMQTPDALMDLAEIARGHPNTIVVPKVRDGADVMKLSHCLQQLRAREALSDDIAICATLTETPQSLLNAATFQSCGPDLRYVSWGPIDLAAALGASTNRRENGAFDAIYDWARGMCLVVGRSAGALAIDTICANYKDLTVLRAECLAAARAGFIGKTAIHPDQVPIINEMFRPEAQEVDRAEKIIAAFTGEAGTVGIGGEMHDLPHLVQARHIVARATARGVRADA